MPRTWENREIHRINAPNSWELGARTEDLRGAIRLIVRDHGGCKVTELRGRIDGANADLVLELLLEHAHGDSMPLIVDLRAATLADNAAVRMLGLLDGRLGEGRRLHLVLGRHGLAGPAQETLASRVGGIEIHENSDAAVFAAHRRV